MPLYKLIVAYDGTRFHGFQRQIDNLAMMERMKDKLLLASMRPKKRPHYDLSNNTGVRKGCNISIQEILEMALLEMFPASSIHDIAFKFAGRTDKGVHARGQVCTIQLPPNAGFASDEEESHPCSNKGPLTVNSQTMAFSNHEFDSTAFNYEVACWKLRKDMNSRLPIDISVQHVSCLTLERETSDMLDPRRDVQLKQYTYTVRYRRMSSTGSNLIDSSGPHSMRTAFDSPCLWVVPWSIMDDQLQFLCQQFAGHSKNYFHFIHKADRCKNECNMLTIQRMEFEILNVTTEHIYGTSPLSSVVSDPDTAVLPCNLPNESISEIVTGRFIFEAKSFRRTMLRNIVGYCMDVCRNLNGVPSLDSVFNVPTNPLLKNDTPTVIINAAPASGLCLEWVKY